MAILLLIGGLIFKVLQYARTPAPYVIPVPPAPMTWSGVVFRLLREAILFESLFRASKWTWVFGWLFHYALAVVLLRHLFFVTDPIWHWVIWMFPIGDYASWIMLLSLFGLWGRRLLVDRIRYISTPSDHLMLLLLIGIGISGLLLRYKFHTDIIGVRQFVLGIRNLSPIEIPTDPLLLFHLGCVIVLVAIFPFSKLIHFPGAFFSPSHNQRNAPRI